MKGPNIIHIDRYRRCFNLFLFCMQRYKMLFVCVGRKDFVYYTSIFSYIYVKKKSCKVLCAYQHTINRHTTAIPRGVSFALLMKLIQLFVLIYIGI